MTTTVTFKGGPLATVINKPVKLTGSYGGGFTFDLSANGFDQTALDTLENETNTKGNTQYGVPLCQMYTVSDYSDTESKMVAAWGAATKESSDDKILRGYVSVSDGVATVTFVGAPQNSASATARAIIGKDGKFIEAEVYTKSGVLASKDAAQSQWGDLISGVSEASNPPAPAA